MKGRDALIGLWRDGRFAHVVTALVVLGFALAVRDYYFFKDDFYFLDEVIRDPIASMLPEQEDFLYRPLSQYGFFGLGYWLFDTRPTGYYLLSLGILCGICVASYPVVRFLGFDRWEAGLGCAVLMLSEPMRACLVWLSFVQQSLDVLLLLVMMCFEIRWLKRRKPIHKALAIACFGLGLAANLYVVVALPLLVLLYVRYTTRAGGPAPRELAPGLLTSLVACALLFAAFFAVSQQAPAHALFEAGLGRPDSPYYVEITPRRAVVNLWRFTRSLFPYGAATAPLVGGLFLSWGVFRFRDGGTQGRRWGRESVTGVFALAWVLLALAPFLFLANRTTGPMSLLAGVAAYPLLVALLIAPLRRLRRARWAWLAGAAVFVLLAHHAELARDHLARPRGRTQRAGLEQMRKLADRRFPDASKILLVNEVALRAGKDPDPRDGVWMSYGFGHISPVFMNGRDVEFLRSDVEERIAERGEEAGVILYDPHFRFIRAYMPRR